MRPKNHLRATGPAARRQPGSGSGVFRRGTPTRELVLVKLAFWGVVIGFILMVALVLWGLATRRPSHYPTWGFD